MSFIGLPVPDSDDVVEINIRDLGYYEGLKRSDRPSFKKEVMVLIGGYQNPARSGRERMCCFWLLKQLGVDVSTFSWPVIGR